MTKSIRRRSAKSGSNPLHDPVAALTFLVDFAQVDLSGLRPPQRHALVRDVRHLLDRESAPGAELAADLSDPVLAEMQRRAYRAIAPAGGPRGFAMAGDLILSFYALPADDGRWHIQVRGTTLHRLLYQALRVVGAVGLSKVQRCPAPKCGRLFVQRVTRKQYCSTRCQARAYMRAYREDLYGKPARKK